MKGEASGDESADKALALSAIRWELSSQDRAGADNLVGTLEFLDERCASDVGIDALVGEFASDTDATKPSSSPRADPGMGKPVVVDQIDLAEPIEYLFDDRGRVSAFVEFGLELFACVLSVAEKSKHTILGQGQLYR